MSARFRFQSKHLGSSLVLHVTHHNFGYSRNDFSRLRPYRVLRQVPGHSRKRSPLDPPWRPTRRCRCDSRRRPLRSALLGLPRLLQLLLPPPSPVVVRMSCVPCLVRSSVACAATLGRAAGALTGAHARIWQEPAATLRARAFLLHRSRQLSATVPPAISSRHHGSVGLFCLAEPGLFS